GDHPIAIGAEHGGRAVDLANPVGLERSQRLQRLRSLAHEKDPARLALDLADELVGRHEIDLKALGLEAFRGEAQNLGVVALAPGRVRLFAEDAPAICITHSHVFPSWQGAAKRPLASLPGGILIARGGRRPAIRPAPRPRPGPSPRPFPSLLRTSGRPGRAAS